MISGMCPEYNSKVGKIDVSSCSHSQSCPTEIYWSNEVYKCKKHKKMLWLRFISCIPAYPLFFLFFYSELGLKHYIDYMYKKISKRYLTLQSVVKNI